MSVLLPPLPQPLDPSVVRYRDGRPTVALIDYERKLTEYLRALGAALQGS